MSAAPDLTEALAGWSQADAIALCREIEAICPDYGCHVALTGGCLYKDGERKDLDVLFYRIRQVERIDQDGLFDALRAVGIEHLADYGWCNKATYRGRKIDCFFPECPSGDYGTSTIPTAVLLTPDDEVAF